MDTFAVLAEPTRRRILDELRSSERSVGELADMLSVSQPTMSRSRRAYRTSTPETSAASAAFAAATTTRETPDRRAASTDGSTPRTGRSRPSSPSSATNTAPATASAGT